MPSCAVIQVAKLWFDIELLDSEPMVKTRKDMKVVTALPVSKPADVPVVSALAEESVPEKAPQPSPSSPSTSGAEADSRPVRVYADGTTDDCQVLL